MATISSNVTAMYAYIRAQTLVESGDVSDATLLTFINRGYGELAARFAWPWLEETALITAVASQSGYTLPTDYLRTIAIVDNDSRRRLKRLSQEEAWSIYGGDFPTGTTSHYYYLFEGKIELVPTPSANDTDRWTHYYIEQPVALSAGGDVPAFTGEFHLILADYAIARVWEWEEDFAKAAAADERFERGIGALALHYFNRTEDTPMIYGGHGGPPSPPPVRWNMPFLDGGL